MPSFETTRPVPFSPVQMFDLVADVEQYPQFLPLCEGIRVISRDEVGPNAVIVAAMNVGYGAIRETFISRVTLDRAGLLVAADLVEGPFNRLENRWSFTATPTGCDVRFAIAYEFKSLMLQMLVGGLFDQAVRKYTEAFEARAHQVYGQPSKQAPPTA